MTSDSPTRFNDSSLPPANTTPSDRWYSPFLGHKLHQTNRLIARYRAELDLIASRMDAADAYPTFIDAVVVALWPDYQWQVVGYYAGKLESKVDTQVREETERSDRRICRGLSHLLQMLEAARQSARRLGAPLEVVLDMALSASGIRPASCQEAPRPLPPDELVPEIELLRGPEGSICDLRSCREWRVCVPDPNKPELQQVSYELALGIWKEYRQKDSRWRLPAANELWTFAAAWDVTAGGPPGWFWTLHEGIPTWDISCVSFAGGQSRQWDQMSPASLILVRAREEIARMRPRSA